MNERWRLELNSEAPHNPPQWVELRDTNGKRYRFMELTDAEAARQKLLTSQPHMRDRLRIVPI